MSTPATEPTISVVTAAYNGAAFLRETIACLSAQTMPDFEIVVVDDCSKDDSVELLEAIDEPRLRVFRAPKNGGPAVARTIAMDHARGRYIAGLDQDDLCDPTRFARQLAFLDAHPDVVLVTSTIEAFGDGVPHGDQWPDLTDSGMIDWTMTMLNPLGWSTALMRGDAARALTPFERDERRFAEDFDLYHRIRAYGRIGRIADPLVRYRLHPGGASQAFEERMIESTAKVLADRYGDLFCGNELESALLMARHAGASHAPTDTETLAACGRTMTRLLGAYGHLSPEHSLPSAVAIWWRIARSGLRAGHYGMFDMLRARPAFADAETPAPRGLAEDVAFGTVRRFISR